jgi:YVTN family beta-propeller protein
MHRARVERLILTFSAILPAALPPQEQERARHVSTGSELEPERRLFERTLPVERPPAAVEQDARLGPSVGFLTTNQDPEGDMPRAVAFMPDGSAAVIANRDTDTVTFFDVDTRTITHTVAVGDYPLDVAVTPDGHALVPNVFGDSVSVIDVATHAVVATVPVTGTQPYIVRVTSDGALAAVGVINDAVDSAISVIDLATLEEVRVIPTVSQGVYGGFFTPESGISGEIVTQFAVSSDGHTLVLPDRFGSRVAVYDLVTGAEDLIDTADAPTSVDVSLDGDLAVIGHEFTAQAVSTIDLPTRTVTHAFATPDELSDGLIRMTHDESHALFAVLNGVRFVNLTTGAVSPILNTGVVGDIELSFDGQYAFVSNFNARIIDVATKTIVKTIPFAACAESAASPVEYRAVALNNRFREDIHLYDIQGASGFLEGSAQTGVVPEGDAPRTLALAPDGETLLVVHNTSDNAAIVDLASETVLGYASTGATSRGCAISPDGTTAVVANASSSTVSIIDLATRTTVATLPVPSGPAEVLISPDSQTAYVNSVALDRVSFIALDGAASSVLSSLPAGEMGSILYTYNVLSGMALSPDGATLAVCLSFDDRLMLIDTATRTQIVRVPVGDFPIRAAFSPDSSRIYVTHSFSNDLRVVANAGAGSSVIGTVSGIGFPLQVSVDASGAFSYVGSFDSGILHVIDNAAIARVAQVALPGAPRSHALVGDHLLVTTAEGELVHMAAAGAASSVLESIALSGSPSDLVYSAEHNVAVCAQPGIADGVDLVHPSCALGASVTLRNAGPNPTSYSASLPILGSTWSNAVDLTTTGHSVAVLIGFDGAVDVTLAGGQHVLCANTGGHGKLFQLSASGPLAQFQIEIPNDISLCGFSFHAQALHIGGVSPFALSNAQDLVLGD